MNILDILILIILFSFLIGCVENNKITDDINYEGLENMDFNIPSPSIFVPNVEIENIVVPKYNADEISKN